MLDIRWIRDNAGLVQETANKKGIALQVAELLMLDEQRRTHLKEVDRLRHERNKASQLIGQWLKRGELDKAQAAKEEVRLAGETLARLEAELDETEQAYMQHMLLVPNPVSLDTPEGATDADNVELRRVGEPRDFVFPPKSHVQLGEQHALLDIPRGVNIAGTRNYVLKGAGAMLHRAVQQLAIDVLLERGYTLLDVPMLVKEEALANTGFFPLGRDQVFEVKEESKFLIGTSEVSLVSYYGDEIVDAADRPIRLAAATSCFRSEIGSTGRDVQGLYRVHQFAKVEQVVMCKADPLESERMLQELVCNAEEILRLLELPYRVVSVCIGDMSQKTHKQYDIETWMPSRGAYGETHSASNLHDFQARRANIRYRDADGELHYCHTLNNTAVATPRILIPLLENHQQADGSIYIPPALRPYMKGLTHLQPSEG